MIPSAPEPRPARPRLYSDELADLVCDRIADGESLVAICAEPAMPSLRTILRWAEENELFAAEYARARDAQAETLASKVIDAADGADEDHQAAKVKIDAYKWRAAKLSPRKYGEKIDLTSGGEKLKPPTSTLAIQAAALLQQVQERLEADDGAQDGASGG
jgi:hypothetical protein